MNKIYKLLFLAIALMSLGACSDNSFNELDNALLKEPNYLTNVFTPTISVEQINQTAVQTNGLGGYLLGKYTQVPFGTKSVTIVAQVDLPVANPTFGATSQADEVRTNKNERETVTEAYLYLPFYTPNSLLKEPNYQKDTEYQLDSIYGNKSASFKVAVNELNYYLSDIDTDLKSKVYYSNDSDVSSHIGNTITPATNAAITIDNKPMVRYQFDAKTLSTTTKQYDIQAPGLRVPLDASFFQQKIIDKEGSTELSSSERFKRYFKGIAISLNDLSDEVMMLMDLSAAKIEVVYTYSGTTALSKKRFDMPLKGVAMNLINQSGSQLNAPNKFYLGGAMGSTISLTIAAGDIARMKNEKMMITDASIILSVDQSVTYKKEPERLFIYKAASGTTLIDYNFDPTANGQTSAYSELVHLSKLHKENNKGAYYRVRITNHLMNLINNNNAVNEPLAIAVASNVKNTNSLAYKQGSQTGKVPQTSVVTPLGTVITDAKLIIHYTKVK